MGEKLNNGGPAFPRIRNHVDSFGFLHQESDGMTLRDWFAGQAIASGVVNDNPGKEERAALGIPDDASQTTIIAAIAYHLADAMLAARHHPHTAEKVTQGGKSE